jgi:hypothetical protein
VLEAPQPTGRLLHETRAKQPHHLDAALETTTDVEELPAETPRHALHHEAGEGGESDLGVAEEIERAGYSQRRVDIGRLELLIETGQCPPGIRRDAIAHQPREPVELPRRRGQGFGSAAVVERGQEPRVHGPWRGVLRPAGPPEAHLVEQGHGIRERRASSRTRTWIRSSDEST